MDPNLKLFLEEDVLVPVLVAGSIILIVLIRSVAQVLLTRAREQTRREIAAYIAEGSMTPEQGEKLLRANGKNA